jgi:multiple sugar transport system ATP-binding protein
MTMGDRVAVLKDGLLQQCDTPRRMYETPANVFVAGFIGSPAMNLIEAPIVDGGVAFDGAVVPVDRESLSKAVSRGEKTVTLGVRPESFDISADGTGIAVIVNVVEELGADAFAYGTAKVDGGDVDVIVRVDARNTPAKGESLHFLPKAGETHIFSAVSGERLSE